MGETLDVAVLGLGMGRAEGLGRHDVVPGGRGDRRAGDHRIPPAGHMGRLRRHQRHLSLRPCGLKIFQTGRLKIFHGAGAKIFHVAKIFRMRISASLRLHPGTD